MFGSRYDELDVISTSGAVPSKTCSGGLFAMTDFGRQGEHPPPGYIEDIEVSRMAVFVAAVRILVERTRTLSRMGQLPEVARQLLETTRRKLFSDRPGSTADYDAPRSKIT